MARSAADNKKSGLRHPVPGSGDLPCGVASCEPREAKNDTHVQYPTGIEQYFIYQLDSSLDLRWCEISSRGYYLD